MEIIGKIFLLLITLVGYSSGIVVAARGKQAIPGLVDLVVVALLWVGALATGEGLGRWLGLLVWLSGGLITGAVMGAVRAGSCPAVKHAAAVAGKQGSLVKRIRSQWSQFARRMGNFQSRILMMGLYFSVVLPFGFGVRLLSDPLRARKSPEGSGWLLRPSAGAGLDDARRQG